MESGAADERVHARKHALDLLMELSRADIFKPSSKKRRNCTKLAPVKIC